mmetsp:Transcript_8359/g.8663  ORF Transcript_8359/g.8663 Transcript_8359/m.8663 type:complete len:485 (+) Transcript_8359:33-1487(+)
MVETTETQDYLKLSNDSDIKKIIRDEKLFYSDIITKINRYGMSQERNIVITSKAIYNLKKKELKRRIDLLTLKGISSSKLTEEFVLHGMDLEYDYNYISAKRKIIVKFVAEAYLALKGTDLNFCELEEKSLKNYVTLKTEKKKDLSFSRMPENNLTPIRDYYAHVAKPLPSEEVHRSNTIYCKRKDVKEVNLSDFKAIKVLGRGTYGKVTLVEYTKTNELFAMKSLKKDQLIEEDQVQNTLLEKKILQELEHPFLVELVFCFQTTERVYFVLPFMPGGELFQHLKKCRVFEEEKARLYCSQIALALQHLHNYGIIYRDLKPENILMSDKSDDAQLKLIDFGLSKIIGPNETCTEPYGTLSYVAPEVLMEKPYNKQVDMWTVGVMAYLFCVGFLPFDHRDEREIAKQTMCDPTPYPNNYWEKVSNDAKLFVDACLQKNPNKRMTVKEALMHPWIKKYDYESITDKRKVGKNKGDDFELFTSTTNK